MWWVVVVGFLLVSICVLAFLHRVTKLNYIPAYVSVLSFVAFFIPTSIVVLLPIDLASGRADALARVDGDTYPWSYLNHTALLKIWRVSYWLSFSLTLTILPITQSFVESGYRDPSRRFLSSVRHNLKFQAIYLSIGVLGILYIALNTELRSVSDYKSLLIALANTWGLFLAINLLGHGLVNLPRRIWHSADYARQIREIEARAAIVYEKLEDAATEQDGLADQIIALEESGVTRADQEWLEEMAFMIPSAVAKARTRSRSRSRSRLIPRVPTSNSGEEEMARLMNRIRTSKRDRYVAEWRQLVTRYTYFLDCTHASTTTTTTRRSRTLIHRTFRSRLSPRLAYLYYLHLVPLATRLLAISAGLMSVSILWAEVLLNEQTPFLRFIVLPITQWNIEVFSALVLAYMASCCYSTLLRLKLFDRYALLDHGHTTPSSLFFYASYLCRVTIPLSYNFITLLPVSHRNLSTFSQFLATAIDLSPLGTAFNNWFPLYILVPVTLTLLNSYDRLKQTFNLNGTWIDEEEESDENGSSSTGRTLLLNEIGQKYGELISTHRLPPNQTLQESFQDTTHSHDRIGFGLDDQDDQDTSPFLQQQQHSKSSLSFNWKAFRNQINQTVASTQQRIQKWTQNDDTTVV